MHPSAPTPASASAFAVSHALPLQRPALARVCHTAPLAAPHDRALTARTPLRASLSSSSSSPSPSPWHPPSQPAAHAKQSDQPAPPEPGALALARGVLRGAADATRLAVLSAALLLGGAATNPSRTHAGPAAAAGAASAARGAPSDVEAAALTLAGVTVGGLVMRVVVNARRDKGAEQGRVEAECARLAEEERMRALRKERRRLEGGSGLDDSGEDGATGSGPDNETLMSELRQRMAKLDDAGNGNGDGDAADSDAPGSEKNVTGANPSGMGSAVLERPDGDAAAPGAGDADAAEEEEDEEQKLASSDEQDMLKRMWNLSPPEKKE